VKRLGSTERKNKNVLTTTGLLMEGVGNVQQANRVQGQVHIPRSD
jgi:hypothetical protein